jgi:hypothetical protein
MFGYNLPPISKKYFAGRHPAIFGTAIAIISLLLAITLAGSIILLIKENII